MERELEVGRDKVQQLGSGYETVKKNLRRIFNLKKGKRPPGEACRDMNLREMSCSGDLRLKR